MIYFTFLVFLVLLIEINQASGQKHLLLRLGNAFQIQIQAADRAIGSDHLGLHLLCPVLHCFPDSGQINVFSRRQVNLRLRAGKGQDSPVDTVAALALGRVLDTDIGKSA